MAKYNINVKSPAPDTVNRAGGEAYTENPKIALVNLLLTSFQKDKYYESAADETKRLDGLLAAVDPQFAAKTAIYARQRFGMRSITHYTAGWVAKNVKGATWTKRFFSGVVRRADDITEILGAYQALNGGKLHPIPNSLKRGLALKLSTLKAYELAKYKGNAKAIGLVDVANLCHPKASNALENLVNGTLKVADTWESSISAAGKAGDEKEVEAKKKEEWSRLIVEHRLGYFALIRNIRNIIESGVDDAAFAELLKQLQDRNSIKKSLVMPFRILTAYKVAESFHRILTAYKIAQSFHGSYRTREGSAVFVNEVTLVMEALSNAIDLALDNVPELPGKTLVALDRSGSMTYSHINSRSFGESPVPITARDIGAIFGAALAKKGADLMLFDDTARYVGINPNNSVMTIANGLSNESGGTDFNCIFQSAWTSYDRIIILSDMQAWVGYNTPEEAYRDYKMRHNCDPHIYCFNLTAYGDTQFPANKVYQLAGFSDKVFDTMALLETDREALVHEIEAIEL